MTCQKNMRNSKLTFPVRFYPCFLVSRPTLPCCLSTDTPGVYPQKDGYAISRSSDYIIYSVEAEFIERVVAQYGPCAYWSRRGFRYQLTSMSATKVNAIVAGQTSVKAPEKAAFEAHLPKDVHILSCHSLHGPTVSPLGQPLVLWSPLCSAQELINLLRSSFSIGPAKMPLLSWRISCAHFILALFTLALTNTIL